MLLDVQKIEERSGPKCTSTTVHSQVREVIDYMELKKVPPGSYVIREGDSGKRERDNIKFRCQSHMTSITVIVESLNQ